MTNDRIGNIIASLTLEEKASLASGKSFWETQDIPAKGVPSIWLADGPHGLRKEDRLHIRENGGHSVKATCFPTASALACAWSPALARRVGAAIGRECRAHGVAVVLGPGVNIKRSPLCGRNFEYYSEDPLLAGRRCRYQGAGSSLINAHGRPDFLHALVRGGCRDAAYAPGYDPDSECVDAKLEEKALNAARGADTVRLFLGLTDLFETEGYDRAHMRLPFNQLHLLDRLAGAGKDVVVVLAGGSPVETPWLPRAKAVLYTALGGEGVGEAVFQLLYGRACPAGRLAETWPKRLEDTPAARHWPMGPDAVTYNESIYVGYRYYDKAHVDVRFPFGYGLSYTSFAYSGLTLSRKVLAPGKAIEVLFTVENTGTMAGVETAQVYVAHRNSAAHQPVRTLAGFARVALKPGERKTVCVTLPPSALEFYDVARHAFVVEAGRYEVSVGRHSRCLLLHAAFTARGETVALPPAHSAGGPYGSFADNTFPDAAFAAIHTRPLPRNQKPVRGEYTQTTVLGDMLDSRTGRALHALALCAARLGMHFSNNPAVNRRVCEMTVRDLPFKNLVLNTSGIIRYPAAEALLALANGRLFSRGGTVRAERGRSRKG